MDMMIIAGYIGMALLGGLLGWLLSGMLINFQKWRLKKRIVKDIETQKLDNFYCPNAEGKQVRVSLKDMIKEAEKSPVNIEEIELDLEYNEYSIK